jgi:hypothetical protein
MSNRTTIVRCAYCGSASPFLVLESYGWLTLRCSTSPCFKPFEAVIEDGKVIDTRTKEDKQQTPPAAEQDGDDS